MKRVMILLLAAVMVLAVTACTQDTTIEPESVQAMEDAVRDELQGVTPAAGEEAVIVTPEPVQRTSEDATDQLTFNGDALTISYYDFNEGKEVTQQYDLAGGTDATLPLAAVNEFYIVGSIGMDEIQANSVTFLNGNIFVDFKGDTISSLRGAEETTVLEAIAQAYLDNVEDAEAVYYSVDGQDYESENLFQSINDPYMKK